MREQSIMSVTLLLLLLLGLSVLAQGQAGSCKGRCGKNDGSASCQCEATCRDFGDCCQDFELQCLTCTGRCGARFDKSQACQCNTNCAQHKNCCEDHVTSCQKNGSSGPPKQQSSVSSGTITPVATANVQPKGSCVGRCGARFDRKQACQCNTNCAQFQNCCGDHATACQPKASSGSSVQRPSVNSQQTKGSCVGRCGARFDRNQACQCNTNCAQFQNCCGDHATTCKPKASSGSSAQRPSVNSQQPRVTSGPITAAELQAFTEELLQKDTNNVASQLRINRQGQTNSRAADDQALEPLVTIPSSALTGPTIAAFRAMLNNYDPNVAVKEVENKAETQEQTTFLNEVMKTQVMQLTEDFLTTKGKIRRPLKDVLKEIWFTLYRRAGRVDGSSGFEHTFIGEIKDQKVSGFHNWIQFGHEEKDGDLDYKGFMKYVNLGNKGQIIKGRFDWLSDSKPAGSLFVGTSPELEMALYTVCFLVKPDQKCQVKLNNKKVNIQTWTQNSKGKKLIGSAYPDI